MSEEQLMAFLKKVKDDPDLQKKIKAATSTEEVLNLAKTQKHEFAADLLDNLSPEELELVSGGVGCVWRTANCCAYSAAPSVQNTGISGPIEPKT